MKNMKKINHKPILFLLLTSIFFMSCSKDDDVEYITQTVTETVVVTETQTVTVEVPVTQTVTCLLYTSPRPRD